MQSPTTKDIVGQGRSFEEAAQEAWQKKFGKEDPKLLKSGFNMYTTEHGGPERIPDPMKG